jgi:hypothetical protein
MTINTDAATNWEKLKETLKTEAGNMEHEAGEKIVEIRTPSDYEITLVHRKTFKRLLLKYSSGVCLRIEDSAGKVRLEQIPAFVPSLAVDLLQSLS